MMDLQVCNWVLCNLQNDAMYQATIVGSCPQSRDELKTTAHILHCPQMSSQLLRSSNIKNLRAMLQDLDTNPDILKDITGGIDAWRQQANPPAC